MTAPLTLHQLADRAKVLERLVGEKPLLEEIIGLRDRIETGYGKVVAYRKEHGLDGTHDDVLVAAEAKLKDLEADLAKKETAIEIPWYFEAALLMLARDALKWSCVPQGSTVTVDMPGVYSLAVQLDNMPEEPPF